jgi:hypothetical protein
VTDHAADMSAPATSHRNPPGHGGVAGNERLTALTGSVLLLLFAAEGATILSVHRLLTVHFVLGMALVGPALLKIGSTCYRFTRYYTGAPAYRRKGPPAPLLRILGPLVLLSSTAVLGTGVLLAVLGPDSGRWLFLHKATFVCWCAFMTVHVLAYAPRLPRLIAAELRGERTARTRVVLAGRGTRLLLLVLSLLGGAVLAAATTGLVEPWFR